MTLSQRHFYLKKTMASLNVKQCGVLPWRGIDVCGKTDVGMLESVPFELRKLSNCNGSQESDHHVGLALIFLDWSKWTTSYINSIYFSSSIVCTSVCLIFHVFLCFSSPDNIIFEANLFVAISLESRNLQNTSNPRVAFQPWSWFYLAKLSSITPHSRLWSGWFKQLKKRFDKRSKILVPLNCPNGGDSGGSKACDGKHMS